MIFCAVQGTPIDIATAFSTVLQGGNAASLGDASHMVAANGGGVVQGSQPKMLVPLPLSDALDVAGSGSMDLTGSVADPARGFAGTGETVG